MDLDILRRSPLFATLDDAAFKLLTDDITEIDLSRNAVLFYEGDPGDQLYAVLSGKVKLGRTAADGRENMIAIMGPGDVFGEMALFDPSPRSTNAVAVSETRLAAIKHESFKRAQQQDPSISDQVIKTLARRLRHSNEALADLVFSDVPGRLAKALLDLADRFGRPATDGILVAHELTQEELAQLVGASRETVNKALAAPLTFTQAITGALFSVRYPLVSDVDVLPVQVLTFGNIEQRSRHIRRGNHPAASKRLVGI